MTHPLFFFFSLNFLSHCLCLVNLPDSSSTKLAQLRPEWAGQTGPSVTPPLENKTTPGRTYAYAKPLADYCHVTTHSSNTCSIDSSSLYRLDYNRILTPDYDNSSLVY
jgi:hypothetical protein